MTALVNPTPAPAAIPIPTPLTATPNIPPTPSATPNTSSAMAQTPVNPPADAPEPTAAATIPPEALAKYRRVGRVSINLHPTVDNKPQEAESSSTPLTPEMLQKSWDALLQTLPSYNPKLAEVLMGRELRLHEDEQFDIVVHNSYVESEIKPHLTHLLESLRHATGHPLLNGHVLVEYEEKEAIVYSPHDKYNVMLSTNPALASLNSLLPELDY